MTNWGTPARTIRIEAELWAAVKAKAAQQDTTASEAIRELLKEWVKES